jgi:MFS family permease
MVLVIVCAGVVLASLDLFIVNVALPDIARDFGTANVGELSWVLNGYAIAYASLLVFFGRLADRHLRNYGFLLGVAVFTIASAACAASTSVAMLVAFRLVQAAGAALLTPTSLGLVLASYPPEGRGGAVRAWTAIGGVAAALGPVIGGLLVTASWRWVFLVNVPIGVVPRPDALGAVLVTAGTAGLTFALIKGGSWGWGSSTTLAVLAASVIVLVASRCTASMHGIHSSNRSCSVSPTSPERRWWRDCSRPRSAPCCCPSSYGNRTPGDGRR